MGRPSKTQEANEAAINNAGNADRPPQSEINAAVALLKRWEPDRLNPEELPARPVVALQCKFCHVKAESNAKDPRCPRGCHEEGRSTMQPALAKKSA